MKETTMIRVPLETKKRIDTCKGEGKTYERFLNELLDFVDQHSAETLEHIHKAQEERALAGGIA